MRVRLDGQQSDAGTALTALDVRGGWKEEEGRDVSRGEAPKPSSCCADGAPSASTNHHPTESSMTTRSIFLRLLPFVLPFGMQSTALADNPHSASSNKAHPGEFVVEPTTLINAGFEWYVDGDANHNARVEVWYRPVRGN